MRKRIVFIGLIVLIVGVILMVSGYEGIERAPTYDNLIQISNNEYTTDSFTYHAGEIVIVSGGNNESGLICNSNLKYVTASNIANYTIRPDKSTTDGLYYCNLTNNGRYIYVEFSSKSPGIIAYTIATPAEINNLNRYADIVTAGIPISVAGFFVLMIGLILKKK
ncbi:hypothetical protein [Picrophilus oshimae]|uniref:Hypothetical exported protein n=1 Tax=Picrophilus torridus (strain ATCC 700027 / DSM 9790 / JCM 10055 / NBRC 100828 / KAW 2/3) TaxID=1122961 RepID=Q6KZR0_PICTO|nr:hypothetical protein [Picrophilus oshimae]AAT43792.1 hypothetical exported protein [Picrophilus oshimae DSM 9789]SMD31141.1 hypothetical protein SAMN02745355_1062 [Picrophilus oshimae DSM 9789]